MSGVQNLSEILTHISKHSEVIHADGIRRNQPFIETACQLVLWSSLEHLTFYLKHPEMLGVLDLSYR